MTNRGPGKSAQYRTLPGKFERMIIVDREAAVVPDYIVAESPPHAAWLITDPAAVAVLARAFDATWMRARPWMGQLRKRGGDAKDTLSSWGEGQCSPQNGLKQESMQALPSWGRPTPSAVSVSPWMSS